MWKKLGSELLTDEGKLKEQLDSPTQVYTHTHTHTLIPENLENIFIS